MKPRFENAREALTRYWFCMQRVYGIGRSDLRKTHLRIVYSKPGSVHVDLMDLSTRLDKVDREQLILLIERYVFEMNGRVLAENRGVSYGAIGGMISGAIRHVNDALGELIPQNTKSIERKVKKPDKSNHDDVRRYRREKVRALIKKRMSDEKQRRI